MFNEFTPCLPVGSASGWRHGAAADRTPESRGPPNPLRWHLLSQVQQEVRGSLSQLDGRPGWRWWWGPDPKALFQPWWSSCTLGPILIACRAWIVEDRSRRPDGRVSEAIPRSQSRG